ncbi:hypothetical protein HCU74_17765 [Spongiibacter sp. KMU-166]|uniref:Thioesterase domain-containing protein n=1 Tax=Spongiibacter thalassae TaxID=2721624 RepID=A0ABX1GJ82_9GAMM|nr:hypothetical protein [Spongiibacter thalassae]NKI19258.1 hypothetical protein [Spongiibacter thalassae]
MYSTCFVPSVQECRAGGAVYRWALSKWFDDAQREYCAQLTACCGDMPLSWRAVSHRLDFFSDCEATGEVRLEVSVAEVNGHGVSLGCRIVQGSRLCATGSSELVSRDTIHHRSLPLTAGARARLQAEVLTFQRITEVCLG